ncbi:hypothetical protein ABFA25_12915 [Mycobacterium lepromatosis]|uniref:hypothetical protein n=1 Tax=Mycobacterium lepromatosis TaxID=480418 RepID=UPI0006789B92
MPVLISDFEGVSLVAMEGDLGAGRVVSVALPEDIDRIWMQDLAFDQFADCSSRLERQVQRERTG